MNTHFAPNRRRWMLVDDNQEMLAMLSAMAEALTNAPVEAYDSPQAALAAFAAAPDGYELVISDFEMPGMTGVELCRQLHDVNPRQTIFLATGSAFVTEAAAQRAGFDALLNKPFPLAALTNALARAGIETTSACTA